MKRNLAADVDHCEAVAQSIHNLDIVSGLCHNGPMTSKRTKYRDLAARIQTGELLRVGKGVYAKPRDLEGPEGDFYRATLLCGKESAICLLSALQFYGLSEQIFGGTWIIVPYMSYPPMKKVLRPVRSRRPYWKIGIHETRKYKITTIDRSIVDAFRYQRLVGISTAVYALKTALREKMTTKKRIFEMAKKLGVSQTIIPYLEAL